MVANNQNFQGSALDRLKGRVADAMGAGTVSYPLGRRTFHPMVRVAPAANDNRVPAPLIVYRVLAAGAIVALFAATLLD